MTCRKQAGVVWQATEFCIRRLVNQSLTVIRLMIRNKVKHHVFDVRQASHSLKILYIT
jgi:hypothetical protein